MLTRHPGLNVDGKTYGLTEIYTPKSPMLKQVRQQFKLLLIYKSPPYFQ